MSMKGWMWNDVSTGSLGLHVLYKTLTINLSTKYEMYAIKFILLDLYSK
jgi:hypothetical protein